MMDIIIKSNKKIISNLKSPVSHLGRQRCCRTWFVL